jgi:hypothetical protein
MLQDQHVDRRQMAEFLDGDILQHVADPGILNMEGSHPV